MGFCPLGIFSYMGFFPDGILYSVILSSGIFSSGDFFLWDFFLMGFFPTWDFVLMGFFPRTTQRASLLLLARTGGKGLTQRASIITGQALLLASTGGKE